MRAQKASVFGKETSQRGGSCIVSPAAMAAMGSILTNKCPAAVDFYAVFFVRS